MVMNTKSRAYKQIGMRVVDQLNTQFPSSTSINKDSKNGKQIRSEFNILWSMILSQDEVTEFLCTLQNQQMNIFEQKQTSIHGVTIATLVNTISFLLQNLPVKFTSPLLSDFQKNWSNFLNKNTNLDVLREYCNVRLVMRLLATFVHISKNESEKVTNNTNEIQQQQYNINAMVPSTIDDLISSLIVEITTFYTAEQYTKRKLNNTQCYVDDKQLPSNESDFIYQYLLSLIGKNLFVKDTITYQSCLQSYIISKTITLSQQIKTDPYLASITLYGLQYMYQQLQYRESTTSKNLLCQSIQRQKPYLYWPKPYSEWVLYTIQLIQNELLSSGSNHRTKQMKEITVINYNYILASEQQYTCGKPIFYLYDSEDTNIASNQILLDLQVYSREKIISTGSKYDNIYKDNILLPNTKIQILCIVNAINTNLQEDNINIKLDTIKNLTDIQINDIFIKIRKFDISPIALETNDIRSLLDEGKKFYTNLYNEIESMISTNKNEKMNDEIKQLQDMQIQDDYNPPLPPIEHIRIPLRLRSSLDDMQDISPTYPAAYIYERQLELIQMISPETNKIVEKSRVVRTFKYYIIQII